MRKTLQPIEPLLFLSDLAPWLIGMDARGGAHYLAPQV
jgi:hypothetical protein